MKTNVGWKHRALVVAIRWWSALALIAGPGAMALGQVVKPVTVFTNGEMQVNDTQQTLKALITNQTGGAVYDLHVVVSTSKKSTISRVLVQVDYAEFNKDAEWTTKSPDSVESHLTVLPGHFIPQGTAIDIRVTANFKAKEDEKISYLWWWSGKDGKIIPQPVPPVTPPIVTGGRVPVPEPETWAMLAGLGLVGFAANRRLRASRSPR